VTQLKIGRLRRFLVHVALGAGPGQILTLVLGSAMRVVLFGALVGMGGALALTVLLQSLLFGVKAHDRQPSPQCHWC
jgi:putative ABC transport system permease protein